MEQRPLELWGGIECTIVRLGDRYRDQVAETGHRDRPEDLDRIAALGIRTLRYPVLWESVAPDDPGQLDFTWHDERLARLDRLGIRPIAGLLHHGSGPRYTDLLDPAFPALFARYAGEVARRYPGIDLYTPINEPLTTARFSTLYGHWYPHRRDLGSFLRATVLQCRATVLAMRAIRAVNPAAQLVQTEDLGRIFSTPALAYQADHENERRWLTFDLLFGRLDRHHPWWRLFRDHGISAGTLASLRDGEARPDIVGINHYLTSDRFLDERAERYPAHLAGGNGRDTYADVEAVRVARAANDLGPAARLREVWQRYGAPVAVTEVHHGSTRDEQLRWFTEVWDAACTVRIEGADIRAVTGWALAGSVDWNSLLTREKRIYEPGAFDARGPLPCPTALAAAMRSAASGTRPDHPVLDGRGWWHRPSRFHVPPPANDGPAETPEGWRRARAVLLCGPDGPLRRALQRAAETRDLAVRVSDGASAPATAAAIGSGGVWGIISWNDPAETEPGPRIDAPGLPQVVVRSSAADTPDPEGALAVQIGSLFSPLEEDGLIAPIVAGLARGHTTVASAEIVAPTYLPDLVHVLFDLLIDGETGQRYLASGSIQLDRLVALIGGAMRLNSPGTASGWTDSSGGLMPPLDSALARYLDATALDRLAAEPSIAVAAA